jgi:hypothetical protein
MIPGTPRPLLLLPLSLVFLLTSAASHARSAVEGSAGSASPSSTMATKTSDPRKESLTANPSSVGFGNVQVGSSETQSETLTNSTNSSVTISQATITGAGFSLNGLKLPLTLTAGQSYTFRTAFSPKSSGSVSGSIAILSNAPNSNLTISLSGNGTSAAQVTLTPTPENFGSVVVGTSKSLTATLSATGANLTVSSATSTSSEFTLSGLSFPLKIASGQSASFTVKFAPQTSGTASGSISFVSNASNSPATETLTGTGTTVHQHSVALSWTPSSSAVVGYNVYRGSKSGGPYTKLNSVLDASTTYTDSSVQSAQTYYYVTTSVNGKGAQSAYSNQVRAVIP